MGGTLMQQPTGEAQQSAILHSNRQIQWLQHWYEISVCESKIVMVFEFLNRNVIELPDVIIDNF